MTGEHASSALARTRPGVLSCGASHPPLSTCTRLEWPCGKRAVAESDHTRRSMTTRRASVSMCVVAVGPLSQDLTIVCTMCSVDAHWIERPHAHEMHMMLEELLEDNEDGDDEEEDVRTPDMMSKINLRMIIILLC